MQDTVVEGTEEYISRIRGKYEQLSDSERQVADYFLEHRSALPEDLNVKDVSRVSGTSVATVMRFCKAIGFRGFSEFKFSIQSGFLAAIGGSVRIGSRDDMNLIKEKVAEFTRRTITASMQYADSRELERAVEALEKCERVHIAATGTASGVAMSTANTFMIMGLRCHYTADPLTMLRETSFCGKDDLVIGITSCGRIKTVVDALKIARDRGATTIGVTGMPDSLVTRYSDIILHCLLRDNSVSLDLITVSMCQLLTLQTLQVAYLSRRSKAVTRKINQYYSISETTRYAPDLKEIGGDCVRD